MQCWIRSSINKYRQKKQKIQSFVNTGYYNIFESWKEKETNEIDGVLSQVGAIRGNNFMSECNMRIKFYYFIVTKDI